MCVPDHRRGLLQRTPSNTSLPALFDLCVLIHTRLLQQPPSERQGYILCPHLEASFLLGPVIGLRRHLPIWIKFNKNITSFSDDALHSSSSSNMPFIFQPRSTCMPLCCQILLLSLLSLSCHHTLSANPGCRPRPQPSGGLRLMSLGLSCSFSSTLSPSLQVLPLSLPCFRIRYTKRVSEFLCFWVSAGTIFSGPYQPKDQTILASFQMTKASRMFP